MDLYNISPNFDFSQDFQDLVLENAFRFSETPTISDVVEALREAGCRHTSDKGYVENLLQRHGFVVYQDGRALRVTV